VKSYGCHAVTGDRYAGEWPRERFRAHGIEYNLAEKPKSEIYKDLLPLANSRRMDLLGKGVEATRMKNQMQALERRVGRGGRDSIDHPPNGHDDIINAAAGALVAGNGGVRYRCRLPVG
jgi:hypothetical protein